MKAGDTFHPYGLFAGVDIPVWLCRRSEISPGAKICYGCLIRLSGAGFENIKGLSEIIGLQLGVDRRQSQRYIKELEDASLIKRDGNLIEFIWHRWIQEEIPNEEAVPETGDIRSGDYWNDSGGNKGKRITPTLIPDGFHTTNEMWDWYTTSYPNEHVSRQELESNCESFVAYHKARKTRDRNWRKKWEGWVDNAVRNGYLKSEEDEILSKYEPPRNMNKEQWEKYGKSSK